MRLINPIRLEQNTYKSKAQASLVHIKQTVIIRTDRQHNSSASSAFCFLCDQCNFLETDCNF